MMKDKAVCARTYDECGFRRRAACVCVRVQMRGMQQDASNPSSSVAAEAAAGSSASGSSNAQTEVLLVTGSRRPDFWVVPGGGVEPNEEPAAAAVREVLEEAGVVGTLGSCLGTFENQDKRTRTEVYVLQVTEVYEKWEDNTSMGRNRKWFTLEEAKAQLAEHKAAQKLYLDAYSESVG